MEISHNAQDISRKELATRRREGEEPGSEHDVEDSQDRKDNEGLAYDFDNRAKLSAGDSVNEQGSNPLSKRNQGQTHNNETMSNDTLRGDEYNGGQSRAEYHAKPVNERKHGPRETSIDGGNFQPPASNPDEHRTSLDDLQKWPLSQVWQNSSPAEANQKSLPLSGASSAVSLSHSKIEQLPLGRSLEQLMLQPDNIALPPFKKKQSHRIDLGDLGEAIISKTKAKQSRQTDSGVPGWGFGTTGKSKKKTKGKKTVVPPPARFPEMEAYRANVNRLNVNFSHFQNVANEGARHRWSSRIVLHDHVEPAQFKAPYEPWKDHIFPPNYPEFYKTLRNIPDNCVQRVILVEDISPALIDLLGACFEIPPHVFEEHLDESGYRTTRENRQRATAWHSRSSAQGYSSITWYRPVLPLIPMTSRFRTKLVRNVKPSVRCPYDGCQLQERDQSRHYVRLETTGNIWRRTLELCPEPGVYHKGSKTEFPVGWEERATIWTRDIDGCKFGMYLHIQMISLQIF